LVTALIDNVVTISYWMFTATIFIPKFNPPDIVIFFFVLYAFVYMLLCSVFIYSTVAGRKSEINLTVIVSLSYLYPIY